MTVHFSKPDMEKLTVEPSTDTLKAIPAQPSQDETDNPVALDTFGPTIRAPFGHVVLGRAGDKGSNCNVGFFVREEAHWPWLRSFLTADKFKELMDAEYTGGVVDRMEFPDLWAVHFLIHDHLDRGVTANSTYDVLGKFICEFVRTKPVDVPAGFLEKGRI